jgi:regulatory protein
VAEHPDAGPPGSGGRGPRTARFDEVPAVDEAVARDRVADFGAVAGAAERIPADASSSAGGEREVHRIAGLDDLATARSSPDPVVAVEALRPGRREAAPVAGLDGTGVGAAPAPGRTADLRARPAGRRRAVPDAIDGTRTRRARPVPAEPDAGEPSAERSRRVDRWTRRPDPDESSPGATATGRRRGRSVTGADADAAEPAAPDLGSDPVATAREICLRLLTDRARTRHELAQALRRKGVPDDVAEQVLGRFDEVGLIDDAAFAGQWVRSRHRYRGLGRRAIAMELRRKGVDDEIAGEALAEVDGEAEEQRARQLVDKKLRTMVLAGPEERTAAARRLVGMLARKGYGGGVAYGVVRAALAEHGADADELGTDPPPED